MAVVTSGARVVAQPPLERLALHPDLSRLRHACGRHRRAEAVGAAAGREGAGQPLRSRQDPLQRAPRVRGDLAVAARPATVGHELRQHGAGVRREERRPPDEPVPVGLLADGCAYQRAPPAHAGHRRSVGPHLGPDELGPAVPGQLAELRLGQPGKAEAVAPAVQLIGVPQLERQVDVVRRPASVVDRHDERLPVRSEPTCPAAEQLRRDLDAQHLETPPPGQR